MMLWTGPTGPLTHTPRHRRTSLHINEAQIPDQYLADVARHRGDGLSIDEAMFLAGIDADDRLTLWRVTS